MCYNSINTQMQKEALHMATRTHTKLTKEVTNHSRNECMDAEVDERNGASSNYSSNETSHSNF